MSTDPSAFAECHEHALTFPMGGRCPECAVLQAQYERDCAVEDVKRLQIALTDLLRHCDMQPAGETRFERAVISARKALHPDVSGDALRTDDDPLKPVTRSVTTKGE